MIMYLVVEDILDQVHKQVGPGSNPVPHPNGQAWAPDIVGHQVGHFHSKDILGELGLC